MTAGISVAGQQWRQQQWQWRGKQQLARFGAVSLFSSLTDLSIFTILTSFVFSGAVTGIIAATVTARILSGLCNFLLNRNWVFEAGDGLRRQVFWYLVLFSGQLAGSAILVWQLSGLLLPLTLIKIMVDGSMFLLSYQIQRRFIFKKRRKGEEI